MMNIRWFLTVCILLSFLLTNAQFKVLGESPVFKEIEEGQVSMVLLPNGNTMFFQVEKKRHLNVLFTLYSSGYKIIKEGSFSLNVPDDQSQIGKPVIVNNDILIYVFTFVQKNYKQTRVVIDGEKGVIKAMDDSPDVITPLVGMSKGNGLLEPNNFTGGILRSPDHNSYSLIKATNTSIQVATFDAMHKKMQDKQYPFTLNNLTKPEIRDFGYISTDKIYFFLKANKQFLGIIDLNRGVELYPLDINEGNQFRKISSEFNPVSNQVLIHTIFDSDPKHEKFNSYLSAFSVTDKKFIYSKPVDIDEISKKSEDEFGKESGRINVPQDIFVDRHTGNFQILFEKIENESGEYHNYAVTGNLHYTTEHTQIGNIGIVSFDKDGNKTGITIVPRSYNTQGKAISYFHNTSLTGAFQELDKGNQFKIYAYFNSATRPFLFINDIPENLESAKKGKLKTITGVKDANAYYYDPTRSGVITDRSCLFCDPANKRDNYLGIFSAFSYDEEKNVLVTLKVKPDGKDRGMQLSWLQPQ